MRYQRSNFCFFYFDNARAFDPSQATDDGRVSWVVRRGAFAVSVIAQKVVHLEIDVLEALYLLARDRWYESATLEGFSSQLLDHLARQGVLLSDQEEAPFRDLRKRHETLEAEQWHPYSALYYFMSQWRRPLPEATSHDQEIDDPSLLIERHGAPPPTFHGRPDRRAFHALAAPDAPSPFFERLTRRRSSRVFDPDAELDRHRLSTLLYYVWGCQGRMDFIPGVELLKKTSPSGGALHPIEVYPLICHVEGLSPGVYHYDVEHHGLELLQPMEQDEARQLTVDVTVGQAYFHDVQVAFIMTARFFRNFWKYHRIDKALSVVLMDAAFLGQTFYLAAEELDLGALFTGAVNALSIERLLTLEGVREGPIAVCACGTRHADAATMEPDFSPFTPNPDEP